MAAGKNGADLGDFESEPSSSSVDESITPGGPSSSTSSESFVFGAAVKRFGSLFDGEGVAGVAHSDMFSKPGSGGVDGASTGASGGGAACEVAVGGAVAAGAAASAKDPVDKGAALSASGGRESVELLTRWRDGGKGSLLGSLTPSVAMAALIVLSLSIDPLPEPDRFL